MNYLNGIEPILKTEQQLNVFTQFKSLVDYYNLEMSYIDFYNSYCFENKLINDLNPIQVDKLRIEFSMVM